MTDNLTTADSYAGEHTEFVRSTCLYVATKLGEIMEELVVIGGLVPSLLIGHDDLPAGAEPHVGTMDLDLVWCLTNTVTKMRGHFGRRQGAMTSSGGHHARKSNAANGQKAPQIRKRICETPH